MPMEIINDTPFTFAPLPGRIYFPGHSLTLIVKGTFSTEHGRQSTVVEEQIYPCGDEYYPGDDEGVGSVRYESDFAFAKTATDRFMVGHCQGPNPAKARRVDMKVGGSSKSLIVLGDRSWKSTSRYSDPEPFTRIPMRYENSIGGDAHPENPVGKGVEKDSRSVGYPLPNIEYGDHAMNSSLSRPPVAGFGPINRNWQSRRTKQGTYTKSYVKKRWPWFPEDFDWSFFNAAPLDQQTKDGLLGDEIVSVTNMHPEHAQYNTKLPAIRVRCFLNSRNGMLIEHFQEVGMKLDTFWLDMDEEQMVLVWRGWLQVSSDDYPEHSHCFIFAESTSKETELTVVHQRFLEWIEKLKDDDEDPVEEDKPRLTAEELDKIVKTEVKQAKQELRAHLIAQGVLPADVDKAFADAESAEAERLANKDVPLVWSREAVQLLLDKEKPLDELELAELDLSGMDFRGVSIKGTNLTKSNLTGSNLSGCDISGSLLTQTSLRQCRCVETLFVESDLFKADLTEALLSKANLSGAFCDEAVFDRVVADELLMIDASVVKASLKGINAQNSDLSGSDFSGSQIHEANFSLCNMEEASIVECVGSQVNFQESNLTKVRASEANLSPGSCFVECQADESIWNEAVLSGCDFRYCQLERANFIMVDLQQTNFSAVNAKFAKLAGANLTQAKVMLTNLFEATLEKAVLDQTDFRGANLYGAEFLDAKITQVVFEQANLRMTKLAPGGLMHE